MRMTIMIGDLTELATWVLGFGETAKVIEPPDLVDRVTRELEGALAQYGKLPKRPGKVTAGEE
jgi:predicted DNA-binding transcriptional regulator YafY